MNHDNKMEIVTANGDQKIANINEIHKNILTSMKNSADLMIDCDSIGEIDLSFIQLLMVARKTAAQSGGRLRLSSPAPPVMMQLLERGGFISGFGEQTADAAFWMAREGQ